MSSKENSIRFEWRFQNVEKGIRYRVWVFKCTSCPNEIKMRQDYFEKHTGLCKNCSPKITIKEAQKVNRLRPYEARYNNFRARCPETDLSYEDYLEFTKIKHCDYCEDLIPWFEYDCNMYGFFLDRKDNNIGHLKHNLTVCCAICNFTKRDEFTYEEFKIIGKSIKEVKQLRQKN